MENDDPVEASKALDRQILAIPKDRVFTKKTVVFGFGVIMATLLFVISLLFGLAADTNDAVTQEIPGLKDQIADRDETISDLEDINKQSIDAILLLLDVLKENGIVAPEIRITPKD